MDIRGYKTKQLPYHYILFYNIPDDKKSYYRGMSPNREGDNAILTYCYLDNFAGLTFEFLCWARLHEDGSVIYREASKEIRLKIREGTLECDAYIFPEDTIFEEYDERIKSIKDTYGYNVDAVRMSGEELYVDFRHPSCPKDILTTFIDNENMKIEKMWVTEKCIEDGVIHGILINEPYSPTFGVHKGNMVEIVPMRDEEGNIIPVAKLH